VAGNSLLAQSGQDRLTLTADISSVGKASTVVPGFLNYQDNLTVTAHGVLVLERDAQNTNSWNTISTNYTIQVSGGGSEQDLYSSQSWTYQDGNPDNFGIELGTDDFDTGVLHFVAYGPSIDMLPLGQNNSDDARFYADLTWNEFGNDPQSGILNVPTNEQPFSVSGSGHKEDGLSAGTVNDQGTFDASYTVTFQPGGAQLVITSLQTPTLVNGTQHTFVSSDSITLQAKLTPPKAGTPIAWAVVGQNTPSRDLSIAEIHNTDVSGISTFTFSPSQNAHFVHVRQTQYKTGSRVPNDPLNFEVIAGGASLESRLSQTQLGMLKQDEIDTLRQEYVDFQLTLPDRSIVVPAIVDASGNNYNVGNYKVQLSVGLPDHFAAILARYRSQTTVVKGQVIPMPANASIIIASGFRNPRRNVAAGSVHNSQGDISKHVLGRALDLVPAPASVFVNNTQVQLGLYHNLYPALCAASSATGITVLPEKGCCTIVPCGSNENHTHVNW
jgi:hypothetical protein